MCGQLNLAAGPVFSKQVSFSKQLIEERLESHFKYCSKSYAIDQFFNETEIEHLINNCLRKFKSKIRRTYRLSLSPYFQSVFDDYKSRFEDILPLFKSETLRDGVSDGVVLQTQFYIQTNETGLHVDLNTESAYTYYKEKYGIDGLKPYKQLVIPLHVFGDDEAGSEFVTYKNRVIGLYPEQFVHSDNSYNSPNDASVIRDYSQHLFFDESKNRIPFENKMMVPEEVYLSKLSHIPRSAMSSMHIENIFPYKPGSMIVFDTNQVHSSANKNSTMGKYGITIMTYRY